mmetsp:Transcript_4363/g.9994  ORF Transcript_4363/g.9994 Transcript_4363/m.9994 type:complete len:206 (-) Transcript_4363:453-1070(-)
MHTLAGYALSAPPSWPSPTPSPLPLPLPLVLGLLAAAAALPSPWAWLPCWWSCSSAMIMAWTMGPIRAGNPMAPPPKANSIPSGNPSMTTDCTIPPIAAPCGGPWRGGCTVTTCSYHSDAPPDDESPPPAPPAAAAALEELADEDLLVRDRRVMVCWLLQRRGILRNTSRHTGHSLRCLAHLLMHGKQKECPQPKRPTSAGLRQH